MRAGRVNDLSPASRLSPGEAGVHPATRVRRRIAAMALVVAALTGAAGAVLGGSTWHAYGAAAYLAAAVLAVFNPAAIALQVVAGQALAGGILLGPDAPPALMLLPIVPAILVTAELLAIATRWHRPPGRDPAHALRSVGLAAFVGGGGFGAVLLAGEVTGPSGIVAIALASAACIGLAVLLVRRGARA